MADRGLKFRRIEGPYWRARRVVICGQGPSWGDVDLDYLMDAKSEGAKVIAVNGAVEQVPWADYFFTLDHSRENLERITAPSPYVTYVQAVPEDYPGEAHEHVVYLRRISEGGEPDGRPFRERVWEQIPGGLAEDPGEIHTGNSGFGALNLAYHMRPGRIVLLGIDGSGKKRWDGTRNRYLGHVPRLFDTAGPQLSEAGIKVINGSPRTAVRTWSVMSPRAALKWLTTGL